MIFVIIFESGQEDAVTQAAIAVSEALQARGVAIFTGEPIDGGEVTEVPEPWYLSLKAGDKVRAKAEGTPIYLDNGEPALHPRTGAAWTVGAGYEMTVVETPKLAGWLCVHRGTRLADLYVIYSDVYKV